jgi:hypothetical protein
VFVLVGNTNEKAAARVHAAAVMRTILSISPSPNLPDAVVKAGMRRYLLSTTTLYTPSRF